MSYTGLQRMLLREAEKYILSHEYRIGFSLGKKLLGPIEIAHLRANTNQIGEYDGISIILDGLVCVDFDTTSMDIGEQYPLPPTLKERSNRGYHLFYRLPDKGYKWEPKVKWRADVDLLVNVAGAKKRNAYADDPMPFGGHVICSPTPGYTRIWPDETPNKNKLTFAPDWLIDEVSV